MPAGVGPLARIGRRTKGEPLPPHETFEFELEPTQIGCNEHRVSKIGGEEKKEEEAGLAYVLRS
ncbi:hypothetical protein E2562_016340 [Oryza meyeriana var. granulata]|uniref:Uncharacterized protein n=1 Tax=Oryza meyeriana var. granulata TaxID=110450 RepID=A0A6G1DX00_9ORYZ|nr:hypothetical protein E2562_016340 [Oryza meyeriana var. granulata]